MSDVKQLDVKDDILAGQEEKNDYLITFKKPFVFEGKEYTEVDLSGLETKLTGDDYNEIIVQLSVDERTMPETCPMFAFLAASLVTDLPVEFFKAMPAREAMDVKNTVMSYFFA